MHSVLGVLGRALAAGLLLAAVLGAPAAGARDDRPRGLVGEISLAQLPPEALETYALILRGGPFPYRKDGTVFHNRERYLPAQPRGYYTEYTVRTPWETDRGARRIVAGRGGTGDPATSGEYYYTADHYRSFRRIRD